MDLKDQQYRGHFSQGTVMLSRTPEGKRVVNLEYWARRSEIDQWNST
jgi:hypothetical protein